jgi:hypothetical protein
LYVAVVLLFGDVSMTSSAKKAECRRSRVATMVDPRHGADDASRRLTALRKVH